MTIPVIETVRQRTWAHYPGAMPAFIDSFNSGCRLDPETEIVLRTGETITLEEWRRRHQPKEHK